MTYALCVRRGFDMTKRFSVKDARANFSDLLGMVCYGHEAVVVERKGRPMAVLISPEQWERYQELAKASFFAAADRLHELNRDESPEEVERIVAEEVEAVRRERYERPQREAGHPD